MTARSQPPHSAQVANVQLAAANGVVPDEAGILDAMRARLVELSTLEADWDSYGALPVSNRAVATAGTLIGRVLERSGDRGAPHEIMPIADGGVSLEWRYPSLELGLNVCPEGGWSYLLVERDEKGRHYTEGYDLSDDDAVALVFQTVGLLFAR